jgi:FMN phosphatase YigB (HAD superfamily)
MKTFFPFLKALVFDIDFTLYRHEEYYNSQGPLMVERYAKEKNLALEKTIVQISQLREKLGSNGKKASYTLTLETLGISVEVQSRWKNMLFKPENYLLRDENLIATLSELSKNYKIFAFTNNTTLIARKTLSTLGVIDYFDEVWGSEAIGEPKPSIIPYRIIAETYNMPMHSIAAIGDRFNVDLLEPVSNGAVGILVESMDDTYNLIHCLSDPERY